MDRRARRIVIGTCIAPVAIWSPSLAASHYGDRSFGGMFARPDRGWHFIFDAVAQSRGARLGWGGDALGKAQRRWVSNPRADAVHLRWSDDPITVTTPTRGGHTVTRQIRPHSPLTWIVTAVPRAGVPARTIGLMDYRSGQILWSTARRVHR